MICRNVRIYFLCRPGQAQIPKRIFLSFVSPFFSCYYFSILSPLARSLSRSLTPKPQSHADWVADQFKQRGFSAAKRRLAGVLWSQQHFVCGHTIKDLGVAIGRMWKSDPGSTHPTNSVSLALFLSFHFFFVSCFFVSISLSQSLHPPLTLPSLSPFLPMSCSSSYVPSLFCPPSHSPPQPHSFTLFLSQLHVEPTTPLICLEQAIRFSSCLPLPLPADTEPGERDGVKWMWRERERKEVKSLANVTNFR